jgi:hypothetical protein
MYPRFSGFSLVFLSACGGAGGPAKGAEASATETAEPEAQADAPASAAEESEQEVSAGGGLPKECAKPGEVCVPPRKFVVQLCNGTYAEATLHLFHKESPFTRGYLRGKTKAWNASGGASDNDAMLDFDEEVVVLRERSAPQGFQVSGVAWTMDGGWTAQ